MQFEKDIRSDSCQPAAMVRRISDSYELEVIEADRFWIRVVVARDACFPECFQCEVAVFPREVDSEWSDRYLTKGASHKFPEGGHWSPERVVIIEFPDIDSLNAWYESPTYRPLITVSSESNARVTSTC